MSEVMKEKAGPPRCNVCGAVMEAWTRRFVADDSLVWICPNLCNFRETNEEKDKP